MLDCKRRRTPRWGANPDAPPDIERSPPGCRQGGQPPRRVQRNGPADRVDRAACGAISGTERQRPGDCHGLLRRYRLRNREAWAARVSQEPAVEEIRFGDNDSLAGMVAHLVDADLLVILSDVAGLYTDDPRANPKATLISLVAEVTADVQRLAGGTASFEGTGGMRTKVLAAKKAATYGVATVILGGERIEQLSALFEGEDVGTLFLPQEQQLTSRKHWIAHTLKAKGQLVLDDGAVEALTRRGKSLLPSGITAVRGDFEAGDSVACVDHASREIAKGLANYSSQAIAKIMGRKSADIQKTLGYKDYDEVIHRDNLVIE